jgi:hypothetical protein
MAEKKSDYRVACTFDTKCRFDQVQMDLKVINGKKLDHDDVLSYLIKLHEKEQNKTK